MELAKAFGRNTRRRRTALGVTIEALSADVGLSYSYLGELERGRRNPTLRVVERVAKALGTDPIELLRSS
jgi:transcriptional regulator with XRE-family HTH domain